jgi:hypothetical protein
MPQMRSEAVPRNKNNTPRVKGLGISMALSGISTRPSQNPASAIAATEAPSKIEGDFTNSGAADGCSGSMGMSKLISCWSLIVMSSP